MIRVLIVEDDPMVAEFNKRYLSQISGFELISVAKSFNEAEKMLENQKIDLILLDIFMPGQNGLDLLSHIRKNSKEVDVILVTAARDIQTIKKALQYGAVDYLIKPFEFDRFNTALTKYRETHKYMRRKDELSQEELDKLFHSKDQADPAPVIPKGLDRNTLRKVWTSILEIKDKDFSTEEIAQIVGISRVSMRKYVDFLSQIGLLKMEVEYGSVGRPIYKYRCLSSNSSLINHYLTGF